MTEKDSRTRLTITYDEAIRLIGERINSGKQLIGEIIPSKDRLDRANAEYHKWDKYNVELLKIMFTNNMISYEYAKLINRAITVYSSLNEETKSFKKKVREKIERLESITERLSLYNVPIAGDSRIDNHDNKKIFVVHGHDEAVKQSVARTIEKLGLKVIILNERPNNGQTVIEKLESNSDVGFAVILLTSDDIGRAKNESETKPRARQNVLIELGYFIGKLGRQKVCILHTDGVNIPSDFSGVLYEPLDSAGHWRYSLVRELQTAGYDVDANVLLD